MKERYLRGPLAAWLCALALSAPAARADEHGRAAPLLPAFQQECGACHLAYPPGLLPASSWGRIMTGLDRHFGSNASLDPTTTRSIAEWLQAHAGSGRRVGSTAPAHDRITQSDWFARKHREVSAAVWKRPAVASPANCAACHPGGAQGDFEEHRVRIPR